MQWNKHKLINLQINFPNINTKPLSVCKTTKNRDFAGQRYYYLYLFLDSKYIPSVLGTRPETTWLVIKKMDAQFQVSWVISKKDLVEIIKQKIISV